MAASTAKSAFTTNDDCGSETVEPTSCTSKRAGAAEDANDIAVFDVVRRFENAIETPAQPTQLTMVCPAFDTSALLTIVADTPVPRIHVPSVCTPSAKIVAAETVTPFSMREVR